jgi:hypothetical protein
MIEVSPITFLPRCFSVSSSSSLPQYNDDSKTFVSHLQNELRIEPADGAFLTQCTRLIRPVEAEAQLTRTHSATATPPDERRLRGDAALRGADHAVLRCASYAGAPP